MFISLLAVLDCYGRGRHIDFSAAVLVLFFLCKMHACCFNWFMRLLGAGRSPFEAQPAARRAAAATLQA